MTIYVVEFMYDYTTQLGYSTDRKVAEKMAKKFSKEQHEDAWVKEYTLDKNKWCEFCGD